jgi:DNA mismatch endonuclease (patch repair protein)
MVLAIGIGFTLPICPASPIYVFRAGRKAIFVHGCFWHGHNCRRGTRTPKTNHDYWIRKLARNKVRDLAQQEALAAEGWAVMVVWECEIRDLAAQEGRLGVFLCDEHN